MNRRLLSIFAVMLLAFAAMTAGIEFWSGASPQQLAPKEEIHQVPDEVRISDRARAHVLDGHAFGTDVPCKSEFPENWTAEEIIARLKTMAANDNLDWRQEDNGYYVAEEMQPDGLKVRVVVDRERDDLVTGYPVNVERNAC